MVHYIPDTAVEVDKLAEVRAGVGIAERGQPKLNGENENNLYVHRTIIISSF